MERVGPENERILVTGGAGFIGSHLAEALAVNNDVVVYDSLSTGKRENLPEHVEFVHADLRDTAQLDTIVDTVDRVYHQGALVSVRRSIEEPQLSHEINVSATLALLEAARRNDVPVILASSAAIYGPPDTLPIEEHHRLSPSSPYGLEKLAIDHYARLYHEQYGLETVALRYFNVYGTRQTGGDYAGVITAFKNQVERGDPITIEGDGTQTRDFVHVSDVVDANLRAATADIAGVGINIGTGEETSIRDLASTVASLADSSPPITHIDPRPGDIPQSVADISRARTVLDFTPTVDLETGLQELMNPTSDDSVI